MFFDKLTIAIGSDFVSECYSSLHGNWIGTLTMQPHAQKQLAKACIYPGNHVGLVIIGGQEGHACKMQLDSLFFNCFSVRRIWLPDATNVCSVKNERRQGGWSDFFGWNVSVSCVVLIATESLHYISFTSERYVVKVLKMLNCSQRSRICSIWVHFFLLQISCFVLQSYFRWIFLLGDLVRVIGQFFQSFVLKCRLEETLCLSLTKNVWENLNCFSLSGKGINESEGPMFVVFLSNQFLHSFRITTSFRKFCSQKVSNRGFMELFTSTNQNK
jgi:hypothetical protein